MNFILKSAVSGGNSGNFGYYFTSTIANTAYSLLPEAISKLPLLQMKKKNFRFSKFSNLCRRMGY